MTWIFGSFLVTPCALTSCQVVISKTVGRQHVMVVGYNRCVTERSKGDNQAVRFRQSAENRESSQGHAVDQRRLGLL